MLWMRRRLLWAGLRDTYSVDGCVIVGEMGLNLDHGKDWTNERSLDVVVWRGLRLGLRGATARWSLMLVTIV
jgi:hypothetical protein